MGSCMSSKSGDGGVADQTRQQRKPKAKPKAFQGTGNRLGSGGPSGNGNGGGEEDTPAKRAAAAAAKRQKASGATTKKKKPPAQSHAQPLKGPNTEPLMRWNA